MSAPGEAQIGSDAPTAEAKKPRVKRPVKPSKEDHIAQIDQLQEVLNQRRARSDSLRQLVDQKRTSVGGPEVQAARSRLTELSGTFKTELNKKRSLREQLNTLNGSRDELRGKLREMKNKLGTYTTEAKIVERLKNLDTMLNHTSMSIKEEQVFRDEAKKTNALKPLAASYGTLQENLKASETERDAIMKDLKSIDDKLSKIKVEEEKQRADLTSLREKDAAKNSDVPALMKEKDECREVMNALYQKIQELKAEFKAKNNEFWEESKLWREQQMQEKAERDAQREKEYQERQAERQAAAAEFAGEPYHKEIGLCDQLKSHLSKYTQQAQPSTGPTTSAAVKDTNNAFKGMKVVSKEEKVDPEFDSFMGSATKKGKGKKGKSQTSSQTPATQKLNHSLDMMEAFFKLKVKVPSTIAEVPAALEEVENSKRYWLKKQEEAKASGVIPTEEPTASTANGVPKASKKQQPMKEFRVEDWPDIAGNVIKSETTESADDGSVKVSMKVNGESVKVSLTA